MKEKVSTKKRLGQTEFGIYIVAPTTNFSFPYIF